MTTVRALLAQNGGLDESSSSARLDTEILLAHALGKPRAFLYTWPETELSEAEAFRYDSCLQRRRKGEPVAYITGRRAFWSFNLQVNANVLIPRPETELLVELALQHLGEEELLADLGTGSGAIALALASERPRSRVVAVDCSAAALDVATRNAKELQLPNIEFRQGNWCEGLPREKFSLIASNPPYIAAGDPHLQQGDLRFEPDAALIAQEQGLADIRIICAQACEFLRMDGLLVLEHGYNQAAAVRAILQSYNYHNIHSCQDLSGHERVTMARFISGVSRPEIRAES